MIRTKTNYLKSDKYSTSIDFASRYLQFSLINHFSFGECDNSKYSRLLLVQPSLDRTSDDIQMRPFSLP